MKSSGGKVWIPEMVVFKTKVSVLDVKWSKRGDKFSATTGNKLVSTGYFSVEAGWWTCQSMKEHKSTVTCARFDNSGLFVISGSTDLKAYISSSYIPEVDDKYNYDALPYQKTKFGDTLLTIILSSWVNFVCWSPSSSYCYVASHDSVLTAVNNKDGSITTHNLNHSPISLIIPQSDTSLYCISYDRHINQYECDPTNKTFTLQKSLTKEVNSSNEGILPMKKENTSGGGGVADILKRLEGAGQKKGSLVVTNTPNKNIHLSTINSANNYDNSIITSDYAGFIKIWKI